MPTSRSLTPVFPENILTDPQDIEDAIARLGNLIRDRRPRIDEIKRIVADHFGYPTLDIDGPLKSANLVFARHVFWYLARKFNGMSLPEIGRRTGFHDHTSVRHGVQRIERVVLRNPLVAEELEGLRLRIAEAVLLRNGRTENANN